MKRWVFIAILGVGTVAGVIYGHRLASAGEQSGAGNDDAPVQPGSRIERGTNGETVVNLDMATQDRIGLQTVVLAPMTLPQVRSAYGQVLAPTPLISLASEISVNRVAFETSSNDYARLTMLFTQGRNTSVKALQIAQAAMRHDEITLQTAKTRLLSDWGEAIANHADLDTFLGSLAARQTALVRLDLPAGESLKESPIGARLVLPSGGDPIQAQFVGPAARTDPLVQGEGFVFVVTNAAPRLTPGLTLSGFIELPGHPRQGALVPDSAIVRSDEQTWVYAQVSAVKFARRQVGLVEPMRGGWFVRQGVAPGERVVVKGAQMLLSEERRGQIEEAD
jgi:membrane fusion protein, multidrug efflux system